MAMANYSVTALAGVSFLLFCAAAYVAGNGDYENISSSASAIVAFLCALFVVETTMKLQLIGIIVRAGIAGTAFGAGAQMVIGHGDQHPALVPLGTWLLLLSAFHISEYISVALFCPESLSLDSFLLNHSWAYYAAALMALGEYVAECYVFPGIKLHAAAQKVHLAGIGVAVVGDLIRKSAMCQAGTSFNHLVQHQRRPGHRLITTGVYGHCRHPAYFGWAMFALGTQVVLINPVCFLLYLPAIYQFFYKRIRDEENSLLRMFGDEYAAYMERVPFSGIPGCGLGLPESVQVGPTVTGSKLPAASASSNSSSEEGVDGEQNAEHERNETDLASS